MNPLAIDLFCGLGGWSEGLLAEGYDVVGFDIERHVYGEHRYPATLVIQDVCTLHGSQFKNAALIVASPPCQAYSYRAMPWKRAKALPPPDNELFDACFRIQREACAAAGRHIPLIVENVRGAQKWVGHAQWNFGSFYLWGDVPALMPVTFRGDGHKFQGDWFDDPNSQGRQGGQKGRKYDLDANGRKQPGIDLSEIGFNVANARQFGHMVEGVRIKRSDEDRRQHIGTKRKFASVMIAKIPLPLSRHIAATFRRDAAE
jgi:site-specific DNA-cytosine methylase